MVRKARVPGITPGDGDPRHGTENGYQNLHCTCKRCRDAHADYMKNQRANRMARLQPLDERHGTRLLYFNYRCRCVPCTLAANVVRRPTSDITAAISNHVITIGLVESGAAPVSILRHRFTDEQKLLLDDRDWIVNTLIPAELSALARAEAYFKSRFCGEHRAIIVSSVTCADDGSPTLAPDDPRHGTVHAYNKFKCRCGKCRKARSLAQRRIKDSNATNVLQTARLLASGVLKTPPKTWLEKA